MNWRKLTDSEKADLTRINKEIVTEYLSHFPRKSYDLDLLVEYFMDGGKIWRLDTRNAGYDDLLTGDRDEVEEAIADFFDGDGLEDYEIYEISIEHERTYGSMMGLWDFTDYLKHLEDDSADEA